MNLEFLVKRKVSFGNCRFNVNWVWMILVFILNVFFFFISFEGILMVIMVVGDVLIYFIIVVKLLFSGLLSFELKSLFIIR